MVFALWGGAVADSMDRRKLLLITNTGIAVTSVLFWIQAVVGLDSVFVLMALLAVQQASSTDSPARNASIARLVPDDELPAANALGSTVMQTGLVAGPLLAGRPDPRHRPGRALSDRRPGAVRHRVGRDAGCPHCRP